MNALTLLALFLRGILFGHLSLLAENLALRQQLAVLHPQRLASNCPGATAPFGSACFSFGAAGARSWSSSSPKPSFVGIAKGFRYYWRWKSGKPGRPRVPAEVRHLIRRMARENPLWGAPRIQSELALLGHKLSESTIAKYMPRRRTPPSQTWRIFLDNHVGSLASIDFFVVPTVTFRLLCPLWNDCRFFLANR